MAASVYSCECRREAVCRVALNVSQWLRPGVLCPTPRLRPSIATSPLRVSQRQAGTPSPVSYYMAAFIYTYGSRIRAPLSVAHWLASPQSCLRPAKVVTLNVTESTCSYEFCL